MTVRSLGYKRDPHKRPGETPDHDAFALKLRALPPPPFEASAEQYILNILDQGQLGCHDVETEVLTQTGWKLWADYDGKTLLATVNQRTSLLEFQAPTAVQAFDYDGPMHCIDHQSLDFALTPNHRMYQRRWDQSRRTLSSEFSFRPIDQIGWYSGLLASPAGFVGTDLRRVKIGEREYDGDDFLALVALVVSDGWVSGQDNKRGIISFCCFRKDRIETVRALAHRLGIEEASYRPGTWTWTDLGLATWLRANAYVGQIFRSPFKRIPEIIKSVSANQIQIFLKFYGDSCEGANVQFYSASSWIIDDLQELLLRTGRRSGIYERAPRSTVMSDGRQIHAENCTKDITLTVWNGDRLSIERKRQIRVDHYKGPAFCATVPNSTLVTRRNGQVLISGNSCVLNSATQALRASQVQQGAVDPELASRLFLYYLDRAVTHEIEIDNGTYLRTTFEMIGEHGFCPESIWSYDDASTGSPNDKFKQMPDSLAFERAIDQRKLAGPNPPISYRRIYETGQARLDAVKRAITAGHLVCFGTDVSEDFCRGIGIDKPLSPPIGLPIAGGHAMLFAAYKGDIFKVANSWSDSFGDKGYVYFAAEYVMWDNTNDLWIVQTAPLFTPPRA